MANFPTLTRKPTYPLDETSDDAVIRSASEAGYETTRPRFTRSRRNWKLSYIGLSLSDKTSMDTFFFTTLANGSALFTWTHPITSTAYSVRFKKPVAWSLVTKGIYSAEMEISEP